MVHNCMQAKEPSNSLLLPLPDLPCTLLKRLSPCNFCHLPPEKTGVTFGYIACWIQLKSSSRNAQLHRPNNFVPWWNRSCKDSARQSLVRWERIWKDHAGFLRLSWTWGSDGSKLKARDGTVSFDQFRAFTVIYRIVKHVLSWHLPHILDKASRFSKAHKGSHSWLKMSGSLPTAETKRVSSTASQPVAAAGHNAHRPPMMKYRPVRLQVFFCYSLWLFFLGGTVNSLLSIIVNQTRNRDICSSVKPLNLQPKTYLCWIIVLVIGCCSSPMDL